MPVMDGREATQRIRETGSNAVIIALTASSYEEEREQILALGCNDFLRKPFREDVLLELMHRHLGVEFEYVDAAIAEVVGEPDAITLAALPAGLRGQLSEALVLLDVEAIDAVIDTIRVYDTQLAQALAALAERFEYDRMLALLEYQSVPAHHAERTE